jgi:isocitrate dehydrogenase kinase/phosphatase
MTGCATTDDWLKGLLGTSTASVENARKNAVSKVFDYDYRTCYDKMKKLLEEMPQVSIYARKRGLIAIYYNSINTTPVGVFLKKADENRTRVEIASPSSSARDWVAKNLFSEKVLPAAPKEVGLLDD